MSIRLSLFIGITALLLLMALSQSALIYGFNQKLEQEISRETTELTKVVLAMTAKQLQPQPTTMDPDSAAQPEPLRQEVRIIELKGDAALSLDTLDTRLQHTLHQVLTQRDAAFTPGTVHIERERRVNPLIAEFMQYTLLLIAASTAIALLLALWLANRFIQPLNQLVLGFRRLQQGQLGTQVPTSGLREYQFVSEQFNQMSERIQQHAEQSRQLQQQQHLVELGEVSRGMVHALRNPIHTLTLLLEQVATSADADMRRQLSEVAEQKMQQINRSLTALLTLSCDDIDRSKAVSCRTILHDLLLEFSTAKVQFTLEANSDVIVPAAESELRSILHSILSNAVEASPDNGLICITLSNTASAPIQICDQGPGLSADIAANLFSAHCSDKAEGAGMGLYIAQRLMQRHYQGHIDISNQPQGGCCVQLSFGNRE